MLVIDEYADSKLMQQLEALRAAPDASRCLYFKHLARPEVVVNAVLHHLAEQNPQLYMCDDGDVFVLSPNMPIKEAKSVMLEAAGTYGVPVTDAFVEFYEVNAHVNKLLVAVEQKIEARRVALAELEKKRQEARAERKRQEILSSDALLLNAATIASRRASRAAPEIMMIEDDAFSRRLVENLLSKQFAMTSLAHAELALTTYARIAPDMLLLDINLPDVTGLELLEKFIQLDPNAYIVMLSGNADKENIMQAMKLGAKGFVAKPFNREKLFQYLDRCPTIRPQ